MYISKRWLVAAALFVITLVVGASLATAQSSGTILACSASDGTLRIIADPAECKTQDGKEKVIE